MKTYKKLVIGIAALLAVATVAWIGLFGLSADPALGELQREFDMAMSQGDGPPPPEQMRAMLGSLSDQQRRRFFMQNRDTVMQSAMQRMNEMLNLPPEERRREIAARADRVMDARTSNGTNERPFNSPNGFGGSDQMSPSDMIKRIAEFTSPEMRGAFAETKRLIDQELASRGEPPMHPSEMRNAMRPGQ
ncbi:MAG: hypothetical protein AAGB04_05875 [Pseudomonadota bacterium]